MDVVFKDRLPPVDNQSCQIIGLHIDPGPHPGDSLCRTHGIRVCGTKRIEKGREILGESVTLRFSHLMLVLEYTPHTGQALPDNNFPEHGTSRS
jgi:hypothetical protein